MQLKFHHKLQHSPATLKSSSSLKLKPKQQTRILINMSQTSVQESTTISRPVNNHDDDAAMKEIVAAEKPTILSGPSLTPMPKTESISSSRFRRRFKCSQCALTFTSARNLESHLSSAHVQIDDINNREDADGRSVSEVESGHDDDDDDAVSNYSLSPSSVNSDDGEGESDDENDDLGLRAGETDGEFNAEDHEDQIEEAELKPLKSEVDSENDRAETEEEKNVKMDQRKRMKREWETHVRYLQCEKSEPSSSKGVPWHIRLAKHRYLHTNGQEALLDRNIKHLNIKWSHLKLEIDESVIGLKEELTAPECGQQFALKETFDYHLRIHGNFKCAKANCKTTTCCLMDLVNHESDHKVLNNTGKKWYHKCGRCNFQAEEFRLLFRHYLATHCDGVIDNRAFEEYRCGICKFLFSSYSSYFPMLHFLNFHDLSRIDDSSNVHRCKVSECPAYFLTPKQLKIHHKTHHSCTTAEPPNSSNTKKQPTNHSGAIDESPTSSKPKTKKQKRLLFSNVRRKTKITEDGLTVENFVLKKGAKFTCEEASCKKSKFFTKEELEVHQKLHGKFKCNFCETTKNYAPNLCRHELEAHSKTKKDSDTTNTAYIKCPRCNKSSRGRLGYIAHHLEKHFGLASDTPRCLICGFFFFGGKRQFPISVFKHFKIKHDLSKVDSTGDDKIWRCKKENCKAYFLSRLQLSDHVRDIHGRGKRSDTKTNRVMPAECLECGKISMTRGLLNKHMFKCHPDAFLKFFPFPCPVEGCIRRCETEMILNNHISIVHPNPKHSNQHLCPICGKKFWRSLKSHLQSHDEEQQKRVKESKKRYKERRNYICDQCGSTFKDREKLETHKMSHSGQESWTFVCEVCSKKCLTKQKLDEHRRTHTKEKPFQCDHCGVSYAHRHNWRIHVQKKHGLEDVTTRVYKKVNERINTTNDADAQNTPASQKKKIVRKRKKKDWEEEDFSTGESDFSD